MVYIIHIGQLGFLSVVADSGINAMHQLVYRNAYAPQRLTSCSVPRGACPLRSAPLTKMETARIAVAVGILDLSSDILIKESTNELNFKHLPGEATTSPC